MSKLCCSIITVALLTGTGFAQTSAETQASGSASQNTSVQANRSGAQVQSQAAGRASTQSGASSHLGKSSAQAASSSQLASGTTMHATLEKPIDVRKAKPGDQVVAKTTSNVKSSGKVVIPKGSKVVGHVTQARAKGKGQSASQLGIAFDRAILKNGQQVPLNASIQALAASQQSASANMMSDTMDDGAMMGGGAVASGGSAVGGTLGGATGAVGATGGMLVNTAGSATGGLGSTVSNGTAGLNAAGQLSSGSHGVVGLNGLSLDSANNALAQGSVITSKAGNIHLDSGTQMILQVVGK